MTLIELMFTVAISSVAMAVATAVFTTVTTQRRQAERLIEVQSAGAVGLEQLKADLVNAGFRFPAAAFAIHHFNDVTSLVSGSGGTSVIDQSTGCATGGLQPGTDAIEIVTGSPSYAAGILAVATLDTSTGIVNAQLGGALAPFENGTATPAIALFVDAATGDSCIGRTTVSITGSMNVVMLDRQFQDLGSAAATYYQSSAGTYCPRGGMAVYRMMQRRRYFVCAENPTQPDAGFATQTSLYRQLSKVEPAGFDYDGQAVELVQDGIEDLQLSMRVYARTGPLMSPGATDCSPGTGVGGEPSCYCNESPGSTCDIDADPAPSVLRGTSWASWVSGVRIGLTVVGARPIADVATATRPALKDRPISTVADGHRRVVMESGAGLINLSQVRP